MPRRLSPSRRRLALPLVLAAASASAWTLAGCDEDTPGKGQVEIVVDRAGCAATCTLVRYELAVQGGSAGGTCNLYRGSSAGELHVSPALALGSAGAVSVRVAAFCRPPDAGTLSRCCVELGRCLQNLSSTNPACRAAQNVCPSGARPPGPGVRTYYNNNCKTPSAGPDCVRCAGSATFAAGQTELRVNLTAPAGCADAGLGAPSCTQ